MSGPAVDKYYSLKLISSMEFFYKISESVFGSLAKRYEGSFNAIKPSLVSANLNVVLRTWVSVMFFFTLLAYLLSFAVVIVLQLTLTFLIEVFIPVLAIVPILVASTAFVLLYIYPQQKSNNIGKRIEVDLPFALSHMNAIASSGVPPEYMFELLVGFEEYGAISEQARLVVRNIKEFGMSSVVALKNVAKRSPSKTLSEVLAGMSSTIEKGGNLTRYLQGMSEKALFEYRVKREEYMHTLSMYADIYTALLVAAPLMMLSVLAILNILGGLVFGLTIEQMVALITFVILPVMNLVFLLFVHLTYPSI